VTVAQREAAPRERKPSNQERWSYRSREFL
jgi:hypothetical protein